MNAAGIDVSSRKSTVAVLRPFGEVVRLPFDVAHNTEGLASLAEQLKALDGEPVSYWSIQAAIMSRSQKHCMKPVFMSVQ